MLMLPKQIITTFSEMGQHGLFPSYRGTSLIRNAPPKDITVALCIGTYGDPRGVGVSYERSTPVENNFWQE